MTIEQVEKGSFVTLKFSGSLSNEYVDHANKALRKYLDVKTKDIVVDMSDVSFLCSAALGLLFSSLNEAKENGRKFIVCGIREDIHELFVITGVDRHLPIFENIESAESSLA